MLFVKFQIVIFLFIMHHLKALTPEASHDFNKFPARKYIFSYHHGKGLWGQLLSACNVIRLLRETPDFLIVCTMSRLPFITAILYAVIRRIPFALWDDHLSRATKVYTSQDY